MIDQIEYDAPILQWQFSIRRLLFSLNVTTKLRPSLSLGNRDKVSEEFLLRIEFLYSIAVFKKCQPHSLGTIMRIHARSQSHIQLSTNCSHDIGTKAVYNLPKRFFRTVLKSFSEGNKTLLTKVI